MEACEVGLLTVASLRLRGDVYRADAGLIHHFLFPSGYMWHSGPKDRNYSEIMSQAHTFCHDRKAPVSRFSSCITASSSWTLHRQARSVHFLLMFKESVPVGCHIRQYGVQVLRFQLNLLCILVKIRVHTISGKNTK